MKYGWILMAFMLSAVSVEAEVEWNEEWGCSAEYSCRDEGGDSGQTISGGGDEYTLGGYYDQCQAYAYAKQKCTECTWNQYDKQVCSWVTHTGYCYCEQKRRDPGIVGITDCKPYGVCEYVW